MLRSFDQRFNMKCFKMVPFCKWEDNLLDNLHCDNKDIYYLEYLEYMMAGYSFFEDIRLLEKGSYQSLFVDACSGTVVLFLHNTNLRYIL